MSKKILVVDNHPMILRLLAGFLEKQGHEVLVASDGLAALGLLEEFIPDVTLLDLVMPGISGDRLCRIMRNIPRLKDTRIVILSAIAAEEEVDYGAWGADACVAKGSMQSIQAHLIDLFIRFDDNASPPPLPIVNLEGMHFRSITKELLDSKKHFEAIMDHMADGFFELTPHGRIVYVNPAAIRLCGISEEEVLASDFIALFNDASHAQVATLLITPAGQQSISELPPAILRSGRLVELRLVDLRQVEEQPVLVVIARDITRRYLAEQAHEATEARCRELFNNMPAGVAIYEAKDDTASDFVFVDFNPAAEHVEGIPREKVIGRSLSELFPGVQELGLLDVLRRVWKSGKSEHLPISHYQDNRLSGWRENFVFRLPSGEVTAVYNDATQRKQAEHRLEVEAALNEAMARISRQIIASDSIEAIAAVLLDEALDLTGSRYGLVDIKESVSGRLRSAAYSPEIFNICPMHTEGDAVYHEPVGLVRWVMDNRASILSNTPEDDAKALQSDMVEPPPLGRLLAAPAMLEGELVGLIAVANSGRTYTKRDLAVLEQFASLLSLAVQKKRALARIAQLAHYDQLTGLVNRHLFPDRLAQAMIMARRHRKKVALLYIDLDRFKQINDQHGHHAGDAVLKAVAARLRGGLRDSDVVARMGGDEFVAILQDIADAENAMTVAAKLQQQLESPVRFKQQQFVVEASIGISLYPDHGRDIELLLHKADEAMYLAKRSESCRYVLHGAPPPPSTP